MYTGKVMLSNEGFRQYYAFYAKRMSYILPKYFRGSFIFNLFVVRGLMSSMDPFEFKEYKDNANKVDKITKAARKGKYIARTKNYIYSRGYAADNFYGLRSMRAFT